MSVIPPAPSLLTRCAWSDDGDRMRSRNAVGITKLTIPSTVTSIEEGAFGGCTGLTEVTLDGFSEEGWQTEAGISTFAFPPGTKFMIRTGKLSPFGWFLIVALCLMCFGIAAAVYSGQQKKKKKKKGGKNKKKNKDTEEKDVTENPSAGSDETV